MSNSTAPYSASSLFPIQENEAGAGLENGYSLAWFSPDAFISLGDSQESWRQNKPGLFLFLRAELGVLDQASLGAKLKELLKEPLYHKVRFLWVENPAAPLISWRSHSIAVDAQDEKNLVSHRAFLNVRNYAFSIARGVDINLKENAFALEADSDSSSSGFMWSAGYGEHRFFGIEGVSIPMTGASAGCLKFTFRISKEGASDEVFGYPALARLDIGLRIFFRDPEFPVSGDDFYLASHRYPFLQESYDEDRAYAFYPDHIEWQVCLDVLYPLSRQRSYFEFTVPEALNHAGGLPSGFRTNRGYTVHLLPQVGQSEGNSRLVFTSRPATLREEDLEDASLYLAPSGKYELKVPNYTSGDLVPEANVICGISGLEYVKVLDKVPSYLRLEPDQAAFAPAFVSAYALLRDLKGIIESRKNVNSPFLPEDTIDLDMPIEETYSNGLGINDQAREEILNSVKLAYFPPGYQFSEAARSKFMALEIVEEMVNWLQETLQAGARTGGGQEALVSNPVSGANLPAGFRFPTTSWAYFHEGDSAVYYSQPDQAVLYKAESSSSEFLDFMEVPAIGLPGSLTDGQKASLKGNTPEAFLSFPVLPYGNVDPGSLTDMLQLENLLINNFRFGRIRAISEATAYVAPLKNAGRSFTGTTPQGLIAHYSPDPNFTDALQIKTLQLAMNRNGSRIQMANIPHDSSFKAVLQSNQLFMVITDPDALKAYFSSDALKSLPGTTNQVDIESWLFELGTDHWDKNGTILVFKFHDKPLMELAAKPALWSLPNDFNRNKEMASSGLQELIQTALENGASKDPKQRKKYAAIMPAITQANWTGILAFNVAVPLGNLPDSLKALAGGMDPNLFYAQYLGIEVTPVESTGDKLAPKPSSYFALIDYQNNVTPEADISGYNFHVPYLTVIFQNSLITDFAAEVQLFMEYLFHEEAYLLGSTDGRNMISLKGVAERHNGKTTYSFGFSGANRFELSGKTLREVEIVKAQFATDPFKDPRPEPLPITGRFFLWGRIRFVHHEAFDVLSFGAEPKPADPPKPDYLSMSNLQVTMSFKLNTVSSEVTEKKFEFKPQQMAFDLNRSGWRKQSLYEKFPLKFKAFKSVIDDPNALSSSGYMPVNSPLKTVELDDIWYGIEYDLNLGGAGALSGSTGLVAGILVAWVPEEEGLYLGLKLPGATGGKKEVTIQGLLKIVFKSIRFESYKDPAPGVPDNTGYLLKLKNITIKFMVASFPPSGKTEIILFGDPRPSEEVPLRKDKLLGWYASYVNK